MEVNYVVSQDKVGDPPRPLPASGEGFLELTNPDVGLVTWKEAASGEGMILRLQELSGKGAQTILRFPHSNVDRAQLCSGVEDDLGMLPIANNGLSLTLKPFEVVTLRVVNH